MGVMLCCLLSGGGCENPFLMTLGAGWEAKGVALSELMETSGVTAVETVVVCSRGTRSLLSTFLLLMASYLSN